MPKVGVLLSGCGVFDGAEIHEATFTLLTLAQNGAEAICCAPDVDQAVVIDHLTQEPTGETRNVLREAARIARAQIKDVRAVAAEDIDALIIPGGFGAARNLCTFAEAGPDCDVNPDVEALLGGMLKLGKPIGAICIAPALLARVAGKAGVPVTLTIGTDEGTAAALAKAGATHQTCPVTEFVIDREHKVVSTPAYMLGPGPADVYEGVRKCVEQTLKLI